MLEVGIAVIFEEEGSDLQMALGELLGAVNSLFLAYMVVTHVITVIHRAEHLFSTLFCTY